MESFTKTEIPHVYFADWPQHNFRGYYAKVSRKSGKLHKRFRLADFADDHDACKIAAGKEVAAFLRDHPRISKREFAELPRAKRDTDLPMGVRRVEGVVKGFTYKFYEASWSPVPQKQKKRKFSVDKYGDEAAMLLALEARMEGLDELEENG